MCALSQKDSLKIWTKLFATNIIKFESKAAIEDIEPMLIECIEKSNLRDLNYYFLFLSKEHSKKAAAALN